MVIWTFVCHLSAMSPPEASRRRVVQAGSGLLLFGLATGHASAAQHEEPPAEEADPEAPPDLARVRLAHLVPDAPAVDIFADGAPIAEDVPYRTVSEYLEVPPGTYQIQVAPAGAGVEAAVIDEELDVPEGVFSVAAIGEVAEEGTHPLQTLVLEDDVSPLEMEEFARVRAVHASPDAPPVDITVEEGGEPVVQNLAFGEYQGLDVPAGEYQLFVYPAAEPDPAEQEEGMEEEEPAAPVYQTEIVLEPGTASTGWAIGYIDPEQAPADEPFEILVTEDAPPQEVPPEEMPPEEPPEPPEEPPEEMPPEEPPEPEKVPPKEPREPPKDVPKEKRRKEEKKTSC